MIKLTSFNLLFLIFILITIPSYAQVIDTALTVDAVNNCVGFYETQDGIFSKLIRIDLSEGNTYMITLSGEAYVSDDYGFYADPFEGVFLVLNDNSQQDGTALRYHVITTSDTLIFTKGGSDGNSSFFLNAFLVEIDPNHLVEDNKGSFDLHIKQIDK